MKNGMEIERKWNGKFMKKFVGCKVEWKQSGNGKEMEWKERETNDISKWIWKWNGMEKEWKWNFGADETPMTHPKQLTAVSARVLVQLSPVQLTGVSARTSHLRLKNSNYEEGKISRF